MYRPIYAPVRLRHVDSYGTKKGLYVTLLVLIIVALTVLTTKRRGIPGFSSGRTSLARRDMGKCVQYFGSVTIFVADSKTFGNKSDLARRSLECYIKGTEYKLIRIDMDTDPRVNEVCAKHEAALFKRHCAASVYLADTEWMLVIDTETGVVNPDHCIEEWIDDRVDMMFYERFFNWEIAVGSYLVRNTEFSHEFLRKLAEWEFKKLPLWNSNDQGAFMLHLQATLIPYAAWEFDTCYDYWQKATNYQSYMAMVSCVRMALGAQKFWSGKVRIYRKAHGWSRDAWVTHCSNRSHNKRLTSEAKISVKTAFNKLTKNSTRVTTTDKKPQTTNPKWQWFPAFVWLLEHRSSGQAKQRLTSNAPAEKSWKFSAGVRGASLLYTVMPRLPRSFWQENTCAINEISGGSEELQEVVRTQENHVQCLVEYKVALDTVWSEKDFMLHGWKDDLSHKDCPFDSSIDPQQCGANLKEWHWKKVKRLEIAAMKCV
ncbi:hypothetical protein Y032_0128g1457 [Ancylostoma ceylanicum]|nr:hypothetical protein Y032_0128g1457 [Ancylostoma ceylanicum]